LDLRLLAAQAAQVVQLRAADVAAGDDLDPVQRRAVQGVGPLHTDAEAHLADGEGLPQTTALAADHHALKDLNSGPVALHDPGVHLERVAGAEVRDVGPHRLGIQRVQRVHRCFLMTQGTPRRRAWRTAEIGSRRAARYAWLDRALRCGNLTTLPYWGRQPEIRPRRGPRGRGGPAAPAVARRSDLVAERPYATGPGPAASGRSGRGCPSAGPPAPPGHASAPAWCTPVPRAAPRRTAPR